jgi:hypothetical protein
MRRVRSTARRGCWAVLLALAARAGGAAADDPTTDLRGQVVDAQGRPVTELVVFAVEHGSSRIMAAARPDADGLFVMKLAPRVHDFGVMSSRWLMGGYERKGPSSIKLVAQPAFPDIDPQDVVRRAKAWAKVAAPSADGGAFSIGEVSGGVTDETGAPLQGVRLVSLHERSGRLVAVTQTDRQGHFTLVTLAGPTRVYVYAPGLTLKEGRVPGIGHVDLTLAIDTEVETITLRTGRRLAFKIGSSVYPEALPPRQVAAVLSFDYGIALDEGCFCPGDLVNQPAPMGAEADDACGWSRRQGQCHDPRRCPSTTWARACMVPPFWWLRLIQLAPPNPSRLRTAANVPRMWWYDAIRAMQEDDAKVAAGGKGGR